MTAETRQYWTTLATVCVRRLIHLRHDARHGADARQAVRQWLDTLRTLRAADSREPYWTGGPTTTTI